MGIKDDLSKPEFLIGSGCLFIFSLFSIFLHYYAAQSFYKKMTEFIMVLVSNLVCLYIGYLSPELSISTLSLYYILCIIIPFSILYYFLDQTWYHQIYSRTTASTAWLDRVKDADDGEDRQIMERQRQSEINRRAELDQEI